MLLKNPKLLFKSSSFRLITFFTIFFVIGSLAINLYAYTVISSFIHQQSRMEIEKDIAKFNSAHHANSKDNDSREYNEHSGEHYEGEHREREHKEHRAEQIRGELFEEHSNNPFFFRLISSGGSNLVLRIPPDWDDINPEIDLSNLNYSDIGWISLANKYGSNKYEVKTLLLNDNSVIQMGHNVSKREDLLTRIRRVYFFAIIPILILGYIGGLLIADRALNPIRQLINTLNSIVNESKFNIRVPNQNTDKLHEELFSLFNKMLDKIEYLITSMRNVLDNVAHDINTPMARLRGIAELGLQSERIEVQKEALADCIEESERIQIMLKTIMDVSGAETGALKLNPEEFNLNSLIDSVVELYSYVAEEKDITVNTIYSGEIIVTADLTRLRQVFANLLDNAIKYTPSGGTIDIDTSGKEFGVQIKIKDTGFGISENDLNNIWDRLYRGDKSRTERGLGLGLSLVKANVEAHKGTVEVNSKQGKGSVFVVNLPYKI